MKLSPFVSATALVLGLAVLAGATAARPALRDVEQVREGLIAAGIAYEIADKCSTIDVRLLRGIGFLNSLRSHAERLGYSREEIAAYVDDRVEKDRLEAIARQRLADLGAVVGEPATYCRVGMDQIAQSSQIGRLLH